LETARQEYANNIVSKYGATLDGQGRISNYDTIYANSLATYNKAVDAYNSGRMSEEQFEKYEEAWETFVEDIEQYEETLNTLEDEQ
jgi:hypothetical protein